MTIERTELANREYDSIVKNLPSMDELGRMLADARLNEDHRLVDAIIAYMHSKQSWRKS